jgi:hypothetical protein
MTHFLHDVAMPGRSTTDTSAATDRVGLCASCRFVEVITSSRGSTFYLCMLSATNPEFRRYPVLPVQACSGYRPRHGGD